MIRILSRVALWGAVALAVTMALLPKPPHLPIDKFGDKFEHMLAFAVITLLASIAYPRFAPMRLIERLSFLGALIEVLQSIPSLHRDCDIRDWVADTLSVTVVVLIVAAIRKVRVRG
jgi:VanZ family protein